MNTNKNMKINRGTFAIAHTEAHAVVLFGQDDETLLAMTPDAARALAQELDNLATIAEGQNGKPTDIIAYGITASKITPSSNGKEYRN